MSIYKDWGLIENPFKTVALQNNKIDSNLLVGREDVLKRLKNRIRTGPNVVTIEGENGIGKTSLVNISCFRLTQDFLNKTLDELYIQCNTIFQLDETTDNEDFLDYVYFNIGQTFILNKDIIRKNGINLDEMQSMEDYLNTYNMTAINLGAFGFSGGESIELNQSKAFDKIGFRKTINKWLTELTTSKVSGHIICFIDNLELLKTSLNARNKIEFLRDKILNKTGLRWILSGATGIIHGVVSSARLSSILYEPIELEGLSKQYGKEIYLRRIETYSAGNSIDIPLTIVGFQILLDIMGGNIRYALNYADNYCMWIIDQNLKLDTNENKNVALLEWIRQYAGKIHDSFSDNIKPKGRKFFIRIAEHQSSFAYNQYELFGFKSSQEMQPYIQQLENINLIQSLRSDGNGNRKEIAITSKGMLLHAFTLRYRDSYQEEE